MLKQKDWVNVLVEKLGCSKKDAKEYYDLVFDNLKNTISPEESIKVSGFGVFKLRKTMAKEQINLVTQQVEVVPEHFVVTFKPYFELEPKPQSYEVEYDDVAGALEAATAAMIASHVAEEQAKQEKVEEVVEAVVEDSKAEEVTEETPVDFDESKLVWVFDNQACSENEIKKVLMQKTDLSEIDVDASLAIVKNSVRDVAPHTTTITVVEDKETFNFVFNK